MTADAPSSPQHALDAVVGVDVGGTKILAIVMCGDVLATAECPTPAGRGADALAAAIADVTGEASAAAGVRPTRVGIGLPGLVDERGIFRYGPHLPGVVGIDMAALVQERLPARSPAVAVRVDNDGTCSTLAEWQLGVGRGVRNLLFVGLGTGISCGMVLNGRLARGAHGFAGEPGHSTVLAGGPRCACGRLGCWETFASGNGLARLAREAIARGDAPELLASVNGDAVGLRGETVVAALRAGSAEVAAIVDVFAHWVAVGLASIVALMDPELVVIGGGLVEAGDLLLAPIRAAMSEAVFRPEERGGPPVLAAKLGRRAGAIGAALLAAEPQEGK